MKSVCADCGTPIEPNSANLCLSCLRNSVDITADIPKTATLSFCRSCDRYLNPPTAWVAAQLESNELLAICLKKLKSLSKVRLVNAAFLWTEPHSRRLKVSITVQAEVFAATILQQQFEVEFVVHATQCPDCARIAAKNTWQATVQLRQKVSHKRTFFFLEQLILKHRAHQFTTSVSEAKDGLDFFFAQRNHAIKMCDFLSSVVPVKIKGSEQLLSTDTQNGTSSYKFSYSVEIVPICKDDFLVLPAAMARSLSNISQLVICSRIGNTIHFLDPLTLQHAELTPALYWRQPISSLASASMMVEFLVLDIEVQGKTSGKLVLADAQVTPVNASAATEMQTFHARTHLGAILQPGDTVLGYLLTNVNFNSDDFDALEQSRIPDVILVRKSYPNRRKKNKVRKWQLKSIAKEAEPGDTGFGRGALGRRGGVDQAKVEKDYETFLRDLEEDPEMRGAINLYKADNGATAAKDHADDASMQTDGEEEEADFPDIAVDELLEEFDEMDIQAEEEPTVSS